MSSMINIDLDTISPKVAGAVAMCLTMIAGTAPAVGSGGSETNTAAPAAPAPAAPAAGTTGAPAPGLTTTPVMSAADTITATYFPTDPGLAAFPSPENSRMIRNSDGSFSGRPYLIDKSGLIYRLVPPTTAFPTGLTINGVGKNYYTDLYAGAIVRQGGVYLNNPGGQIQYFDTGRGSFYNGTLPDAFATDASGATTSTVATSSVKAPALPAPMSPAPGASGKTLQVGAGKAYATITAAITAAAAGDTVAVDAGTYKEAPPAWTVPLMLQAIGGQAIIDATGMTGSLARGKGALVPCADSIIDGIRVTGVAMDQEGAQLTSGVRPDTGCGYLTLKNVELDGNQSGLGTGGDLTMQITLDGGHFHSNGLPAGNSGNGYTHNIYTGAGTSLILKNGFSSTEPNGGHAIKHRGFALAVSGGGLFNATDAAVFDIPQGSVAPATIDGVIITKPAGANNHAIIDYGSENSDSGNGGLLITNSVINALCDNPFMLIGSGSIVTVDAATKAKTTGVITANGGKIVGL